MKKILLSVVFLSIAFAASAQSAASCKSNSFAKDWSSISLSYSPTTLQYDEIYNIDNVKFNGFSIEYLKGFSINSGLPFFLEVGAGIEWFTCNESESGIVQGMRVKLEESSNLFSVNVPVNLGYKLSFNEKFSIMPHVGLKASFGLSATNKMTVKVSYDGESETESEIYNQYDEDDMGDNTMRRFLLGWQTGITVFYNQFAFGANYGACFANEIYNDIDSKLRTVTISVGYTF